MTQVQFKLNHKGVGELLKSEEMMKICKGAADAAASNLGDGYEVTTYVGPSRVNASIKAVTREAIQENLESNSILKALTPI